METVSKDINEQQNTQTAKLMQSCCWNFCLLLSFLSGGVCASFPTRSEKGELLPHGDDWDESVFLGGIQKGSGCQYVLWRNGTNNC